MNKKWLGGVIVFILSSPLRAEEKVPEDPTLPPSAFASTLPEDIVKKLENLKCVVPQPAACKGPCNVVKGNFLKTKESNWAVLCSHEGTTVIMVFEKDQLNPVEVAERPNNPKSPEYWGPGRRIGSADKKYIQSQYKGVGGPPPPHITHLGIDDKLAGKFSVVHYYDGEKWLDLRGAE